MAIYTTRSKGARQDEALPPNLIVNGGFEAWPNGAGWFAADGDVFGVNWRVRHLNLATSQAQQASSSRYNSLDALIEVTAAAGGFAGIDTTIVYPIWKELQTPATAPYKKYMTFSAWVYNTTPPAAGKGVKLYIYFQATAGGDAAPAAWGSPVPAPIASDPHTGSGWELMSIVRDVPDTLTVSPRVGVLCDIDDASAHQFEVDDAIAVAGFYPEGVEGPADNPILFPPAAWDPTLLTLTVQGTGGAGPVTGVNILQLNGADISSGGAGFAIANLATEVLPTTGNIMMETLDVPPGTIIHSNRLKIKIQPGTCAVSSIQPVGATPVVITAASELLIDLNVVGVGGHQSTWSPPIPNSLTPDQWLAIYLIRNTTTPSAVAGFLSPYFRPDTGLALPAGWGYGRRIGAVKLTKFWDGAQWQLTLAEFTQNGNRVTFKGDYYFQPGQMMDSNAGAGSFSQFVTFSTVPGARGRGPSHLMVFSKKAEFFNAVNQIGVAYPYPPFNNPLVYPVNKNLWTYADTNEGAAYDRTVFFPIDATLGIPGGISKRIGLTDYYPTIIGRFSYFLVSSSGMVVWVGHAGLLPWGAPGSGEKKISRGGRAVVHQSVRLAGALPIPENISGFTVQSGAFEVPVEVRVLGSTPTRFFSMSLQRTQTFDCAVANDTDWVMAVMCDGYDDPLNV